MGLCYVKATVNYSVCISFAIRENGVDGQAKTKKFKVF